MPTIGTPVAVPAGGYDSVVVLRSRHDVGRERCNVLVWLQNMTVQPDSTMPVLQGSISRLLDFVGVDEEPAGAVSRTRLLAAEPGVFRARTALRFTLDAERPVSLQVHDLIGRVVRTVCASSMKRGAYSFFWDGADAQGRRVPEGVYLVRLAAGNCVSTGKLTLLR